MGPSHHTIVECAGLSPRPRALNCFLIEVSLTVADPPVDSFCLGTRQQGRRPLRTSGTGMQLYLGVILWSRSRKLKGQRLWRDPWAAREPDTFALPTAGFPGLLPSSLHHPHVHLLSPSFSFHIHHLLASTDGGQEHCLIPCFPFLFGLHLHLASIVNVDCLPIVPNSPKSA